MKKKLRIVIVVYFIITFLFKKIVLKLITNQKENGVIINLKL